MSDIHILEGSFRGNGSGALQVAYHIPVPTTYQDGTIANYPTDATRTSQVADVPAQDLSDIQDGSLYEYMESFPVNINGDQGAQTATIRARWHDVQTIAAQLVRERYKFYGTTLAQS